MAPRRSLEKLSRRAGVELGLKGARQVAGKSGRTRRPFPPGQQGRAGQQGRRRKRDSEYLTQLREKQKIQWFYGVAAGQLQRYFDASRRRPEATGEELYEVRPGDIISIKPGSSVEPLVRDAISLGFRVPDWLASDQQALNGRVSHRPQRAEIDVPADENRAVEYFAKF